MKRVVKPELLDSDSATPTEVSAALRDLDRIHRWFGGASTSEALVRRAAKESRQLDLSLLDVAAGSGRLIEVVRKRLVRQGLRLIVTPLDRMSTHLSGAHNAVVGDALALPFGERTFDLVHSSIFVHHLEPLEVVRFVDEALRVCRIAVLINDVRRSWLHLGAVYAGFPLFRSRVTRHDGVASIRRAYTGSELASILKQTHARGFEVTRHYLFRLGIIIWK